MFDLPKIATRSRLILIASVAILGLIQAVSLIGLAWVTQQLLEGVLSGSSGLSTALLIVLALLVSLSASCRWFERVVAEWLGNSYVHDVRRTMFNVLVRERVKKAANAAVDRKQGIHMVRFSNDLTALRQWVSMGLARLMSAGLFLVGVVIALSLLNLQVATIVALLLATSLALIALVGIGLERSIRKTRQKRGQLANTVADLVANARHLAAFGRTPRERRRMLKKSQSLGDALANRALWIGGLRGLTDFAHRGIMFTALVVGSIGIQTQQLSVSALLAIIGVAALVGAPLRDLGRVFEYWKNNNVAREKINAFCRSANAPALATRPLSEGNGRVTIRGIVCEPLFNIERNTVAGGQRIALIGDNGTGKSTLLGIIAGLVAADSGRVCLDKLNTRRLSHADRRQAIGIASHQLPLMSGSISKNIRYRNPAASNDEFDRACSEAGIHQKIHSSPGGVNTRLDTFGSGLSDGETARVKLARALLGKPRLLLFDEIESGLDLAGRKLIHTLLSNYPGTIIFATHDDELIQRADQVWQLAHGRIRVSKPESKTNLEREQAIA